MSIPELNDDGLLPVGLHDCSIEEVQSRFGQYQSSDRRCRLYDKLAEYVAEVRSTDFATAIIFDGSFVTDKADPEDIDLIVVLKAGHEFSAELRPFEYNALSRRQVRRRHQFDIFVAEDNEPELQEFIDFFAQVRGDDQLRKGMLRVAL